MSSVKGRYRMMIMHYHVIIARVGNIYHVIAFYLRRLMNRLLMASAKHLRGTVGHVPIKFPAVFNVPKK